MWKVLAEGPLWFSPQQLSGLIHDRSVLVPPSPKVKRFLPLLGVGSMVDASDATVLAKGSYRLKKELSRLKKLGL